MRKLLYLSTLLLLLSACSSKLYIDRSHFLKDGDPTPTVNLSTYRSVQERPGQQADLAVAMAISGGGSRASCFGIGIMMGLEQVLLENGQDALDQVDYISSVSGGGFAGGAYVNALYEHDYFGRTEPFRLKDYVDRQIREDLAYSYMGALLRGNINPRLWFSRVDDGDALEKVIDDHVLGYQRRKEQEKKPSSITLGDLFVPAGESQVPVLYPMHITNSTIINTITTFPFTPDVLDHYMVNGYTHRLKLTKTKEEEEAELDHFSIPLAVGIKASGSFPALISNSTLHSQYHPNRKFLHLFDGGVSDNIGYETALRVLNQDDALRKVLFIVDADASGNRYTFSKKEGAFISIKVFGRLPASGLEAKRATLLSTVNAVTGSFNITPFYFGFNAFQRQREDIPPEEINIKKEQKRVIELLRSEAEISPRDMHIIYELLVNIGTKYTIKPDEQELLFLAGQKVVLMQKRDILRVLGNR